jgi:hypothetical protein
MSNDEMKSVLDAVEADLTAERQGNQRSMIIGGIAVLLIGGYLAVLHGQITRFLDPEELALAATGAAVEAAPGVEAQLRVLVVDGAPDIARSMSNAVVDAIPTYRQTLEEELKPVIDEVSVVLATTAVNRMLAAEGGQAAAEAAGLDAAADAVIARLDGVLNEAMDEPSQLDGPSPADLIETSIEKLTMVDRGLRRLARGGGDEAERELVMTLLGAIDASQAQRDTTEQDAYRTRARSGQGETKGADAAKPSKPEGK